MNDTVKSFKSFKSLSSSSHRTTPDEYLTKIIQTGNIQNFYIRDQDDSEVPVNNKSSFHF